MMCPCCGKKITEVVVITGTKVHAQLKSNKISDYGEPEEIESAKRIECPICNEDICIFIEED